MCHCGGPAGLFSAYYCQARGLQVLLLEADDALGGRLNLYRHMEIYDLPGQYGVTGGLYLQGLLKQMDMAKVDVRCSEQILNVEKVGDLFELTTIQGNYQAKTVIVATGNGYQTQRRLSNVESELNAFISYELKAVPAGQLKFAVVGFNPMAIDWAIQLKSSGHDVTLYTKGLHKIHPFLFEQLQKLTIQIYPFEWVEQLCLINGMPTISGENFEKVFVHVGVQKQKIVYTPKYELLDNGLTSVAGLFVAGDVRNETGKLKLLLGAAHDAMQASNEVNRYLYPEDHYQPIVSTHHPIFKEWNQ